MKLPYGTLGVSERGIVSSHENENKERILLSEILEEQRYFIRYEDFI